MSAQDCGYVGSNPSEADTILPMENLRRAPWIDGIQLMTFSEKYVIYIETYIEHFSGYVNELLWFYTFLGKYFS